MTKPGFPLLLILASALLPFSPPASAQPAPAVRQITLGNSVASLDGIWKFHPGDSPSLNGAPLWAQPAFDDAQWASVDMTPKSGSPDPLFAATGYLPGWTKRGYPQLTGFAWYRLRVRVANPGQPLWLKMPLEVDDAYQVFANGRRVGEFGHFHSGHVRLYYNHSASFPLPAPGPDGEIALALRFYMSPSTPFGSPDAGGMHAPPVLGLASTVRLLQAADDDALLHYQFGPLLAALIYLLVVPLPLWAWLRNRQEPAWLWLSLAVACLIFVELESSVSILSYALSLGPDTILNSVILSTLILPLWIMFWWSWFGLREKRWIPLAAWTLTAVRMLAVFCLNSPLMGFSFLPPSSLHLFNIASLACIAALALLLLAVLVAGFRRDRTEALLAAVPVLLLEFAQFSRWLATTFDLPTAFHRFGLTIGIGQVADILMVLVIGALALRRFVRTEVREKVGQTALALDLEQARQLQQRVLVPETIASPHFQVESEYRPAQTVGGDFFQTVTRPDGSLIVLIGDVSGKGISAAMLVAVLVGAARTFVDEDRSGADPGALLATLNRRLMGRSGGQLATCLAAELRPNGTLRVANAGHLAPYLNGEELELSGSLPLGAVEALDPALSQFTLHPGDVLTFATDGVIEASNASKELFGFDRLRQISLRSAAAIAQQAQAFGQEDDITVLRVTFSGAPSPREELLAASPAS